MEQGVDRGGVNYLSTNTLSDHPTLTRDIGAEYLLQLADFGSRRYESGYNLPACRTPSCKNRQRIENLYDHSLGDSLQQDI